MPIEHDQAENLSRFARNIHRLRLAFLEQQVDQLTQHNGLRSRTVLDIGCGDGVLTTVVAAHCGRAASVVGVELDSARIERARRRCASPTAFIRAKGTHLPLADGSCQGIVLHHVIEHIPGDRTVLQECVRVLEDGGWMILGIPQEGGRSGRILRRLHPGLYARGGHINFYTIKSMGRMLAEAGFDIQELHTFGLLVPCYYLHMLLIWNPWTFRLGHRLSQRYRHLADSLTFVVRKRARA